MLLTSLMVHITFETNAPPGTTARLIEAKDIFIDLALHNLEVANEGSDALLIQPNRVLIAPYLDDGEVGYAVESSVDLVLGEDLHVTRMQPHFATVRLERVMLAGCSAVWLWPRLLDDGVMVRGDAFEVHGKQSKQLAAVALAYLAEHVDYAEPGL